jgi:hypothetical protein
VVWKKHIEFFFTFYTLWITVFMCSFYSNSFLQLLKLLFLWYSPQSIPMVKSVRPFSSRLVFGCAWASVWFILDIYSCSWKNCRNTITQSTNQ